MKIAVCDDERIIVNQIIDMIKKNFPSYETQAFFSGEEVLASKQEYDVFLLDIQMQQKNGIEVAKKLRERDQDVAIIFVTGAKEYVFDAFDVAALHYLLKPVDEEKLKEVLNRAARDIQSKINKEKRQLFIKTREKSCSINVEDIYYLENEMRKIVVHTKKEAITYYCAMSEVEKSVGAGFYRCHRGYLVNLAYVAEYDSDSIRLVNGDRVYLAKDRYQDFVKQYMRYIRNGRALYV